MPSLATDPAGEKTRVLFVSHSPHFYGAEQSFCFLLENLDRERIEPFVVLPPCPRGFDDILYRRIAACRIPIHIVDSRLWLDFAAPEALPERLFLELSVVGRYLALIDEESIDVVYTNTITKISAAIAASLAGIPHVYHVREVLEDHPLNSPFGDATTFRIIDLLSDRIITNSQAVALQFEGISAPGKVTAVYNAVDTSSFEGTFEENRLRQELGIPPQVPLIGIVGTVHRHKNHEDLIRALAVLKKRNVSGHVLAIGYRVQDYAEYLDDLISSLNVGDRVHFLEFRSDMPQVYHDLDLLVVASLGEPFGRTTIEAMAAGKPVVATNAGASPEIVVDGVTGHLVPLNAPERMADAIADVLQNPKRARSMGQNGKERGQAHFSPQSYLSGVHAVIEDAARKAKSPVSPALLLAQLLAAVPKEELKWFLEVAASESERIAGYLESAGRGARIVGSHTPPDDRLRGMESEIASLREQLRHNSSSLRAAEDEIERLGREATDLRGSLSWKITAPLRALAVPLAGVLHRLRQ